MVHDAFYGVVVPIYYVDNFYGEFQIGYD